MPLLNINITRIEEQLALPDDLLKDEKVHLWGVLETEGKVYKFELREVISLLAQDPRVAKLVTDMASLTSKVNNLERCIDENEMIEP